MALPQLEVPIPEEQAVTEWQTTFLGERYRVGRGQSANVFLFERLGMDATDHL